MILLYSNIHTCKLKKRDKNLLKIIVHAVPVLDTTTARSRYFGKGKAVLAGFTCSSFGE